MRFFPKEAIPLNFISKRLSCKTFPCWSLLLQWRWTQRVLLMGGFPGGRGKAWGLVTGRGAKAHVWANHIYALTSLFSDPLLRLLISFISM